MKHSDNMLNDALDCTGLSFRHKLGAMQEPCTGELKASHQIFCLAGILAVTVSLHSCYYLTH